VIATVIGFCHLRHAIVGSAAARAGLFAGRGGSAADFGRFLLRTTPGNAAGGAFFVGSLKYNHGARGGHFRK
jgi:formate/nitrite transporter FocA (FNT family)